MRRSKVLDKLRSGEFANCFKVNIPDPRVAEIVALSGFDCVWLDQEHIGQDWSAMAASIWAAKAHDADIMVRIARGGYSDYVRPLELDATGIMVPHVMGVDDARKVIEMTRFYPQGRRALDGGNNDAAYAMMDFHDYIKTANRERFVVLQIEDPEPMEELEEIAALDGFDVLFFGPGDYSQGIGHPGEWDHPRIVDARKRIAEVAHQYGKFAGTVGSPANLEELKEMGYHFVSSGADVVGLAKYCREIRTAFGNDQEQDSKGGYFEG